MLIAERRREVDAPDPPEVNDVMEEIENRRVIDGWLFEGATFCGGTCANGIVGTVVEVLLLLAEL